MRIILDTKTFKEYVALNNKKKELESELKEVKEQMIEKEPFLIDNLISNDMTKISIAGKTCYTKINTFAVIKNRTDAIQVLRNTGYEDYIKEGINAQSISKLVRDLIEENGSLPEEFGDVITKGQNSKLGVTAA